METDNNTIVKKLDELIAGSSIPFKITRGTKCGTPELWDEEISYELGKEQRYYTVRSALDEGGQAIGCWHSDADTSILQELLSTTKECQLWTLQNEAISPGEEFVYWQLDIGEGPEQHSFSLTFPYDSKLKQKLQAIDTLMRRIAYLLSSKKLGYELAVGVEIDRTTSPCRVSMHLINAGSQACRVHNPLAKQFSETNSVSIQVAAPEDPENPSGLGFEYHAIAIKVVSPLDKVWDQAYLTLGPQQIIHVPIVCAVDANALRGHFLRAVYTGYDADHDEPQDAQSDDESQNKLPILKGKAFSFETAI